MRSLCSPICISKAAPSYSLSASQPYLFRDGGEHALVDVRVQRVDRLHHFEDIAERTGVHELERYLDLAVLVVGAVAPDQILALVLSEQHLEVVQHLVSRVLIVRIDSLAERRGG